ncbi:MAG: hypothetical protein IT459_17820 [Planctomycetes bacterium]|nr:hypothetical protein [Planctomycetota bacterium]
MNAVWILVLVLGSGFDDARSSRFVDAVRSAHGASTTQECEAAARAFEALLDAEFDSAEVRFNAGNAWLAADQLGRAIAQYETATRMRPRDAAIAANLALARRRAGQVEPEVDPLDSIVFWQRWLSYAEKARVTVIGLVFAFGALCIATWTGRRAWRRVGLVGLALVAVFAVGLVRDVVEHEWTTRGVVARNGEIARKGAAAEFAAAFNEPLPEGTTFRVLEQRPEWIHVEIDGGLDAWLPRAAVAFIGSN